MISKFLNTLKNSGSASLAATVIFFAGMLISTYLLFTLPHALTMKGGLPTLTLAWPVLTDLFVSVGLTFLAGIATINVALQSRKETVVYLEKRNEDHSTASLREESTAGEQQDASDFKAALQLVKEKSEILQLGLNKLCQRWQAGQGAIYQLTAGDRQQAMELVCGFALPVGENGGHRFELGEGLIGQAAASGSTLYVDEVPEGYINVVSGLGTASPRYLLIVPMKKGDQVKGILEMATFSPLHEVQRKQVEERVKVLAEMIN